MHSKKYIAILAIGILVSYLIGCQKNPTSPVIARVGSAVLTLENLEKLLPKDYVASATRDHKITIVKQWIDNQILFQEALRQKIDKDKNIQARLEKMREDLFCAEIISRSSITPVTTTVSDDQIKEYYTNNKEQFTRDRDMIRFCEITVADMKTAWIVRNQVTLDNFYALATKYSKKPACEPDKAQYVALDDLPEEIRIVVSQIRVDGTTSPIQTAEGVSIFRILDKPKKGSVKSFAECEVEIKGQLSTQDQTSSMEALLADLRMKVNVEFDFSGITGQTQPVSIPAVVDSSSLHAVHTDTVSSE